MANRYQTFSYTSSSVGAGTTLQTNQSIGPNLLNIQSVTITPDTATGSYSFRIYKNNSFAAAKRLFRLENISGTGYDPVDNSSGTPAQALEGSNVPYDNENSDGNIHLEFVNNDVNAHMYVVTIEYEEVPAVDSNGSATFRLSVRGTAVAFSGLPSSPVEGMLIPVTDSTTNTWGATIAGSGGNHVLAYYDGTNWTVAAK